MTRAIQSIAVGDALPESQIDITQALIDEYAQLSGDFNPIHVDAAAAALGPFGGTIAHGCIPLEPMFHSVFKWMGSDTLPEQTALRLRYRAPSRPGDTITARARVGDQEATEEGARVVIDFDCVNQEGRVVIEGACELVLVHS